MKTFLVSSLILLSIPSDAGPPAKVKAKADPPIVIDAPATAKIFVPVTVKLNGAFPTTQLRETFTPAEAWKEPLAAADGVGFRFTGQPGKYHYFVEYVDFDHKLWGSAEADIEIVGAAPTPVPVPPIPSGPFLDSLQAAYSSSNETDRAASLAFLQHAYAGMAASNLASMATNGDLFAWMKSVIAAPSVGLKDTQLSAVRRVISADLLAAFGSNPTTPIDLAKSKAELAKVSNALAGVK